MLPILADENINGRYLKTLISRFPNLDVVRAQDCGLQGVDDPRLLEWSAAHNRVVLTHDRETMIHFAAERIRLNRHMPGLIIVNESAEKARVVDDTGLVLQTLAAEEMANQIVFVPL